MTTSSGTPDPGRPRRLPTNDASKLRFEKWLRNPEQPLNLTHEDLRGADLSGMVFPDAWFSGCDLTDVPMRGSDLYRGHFEGARLGGADLARADLARADLSGADLRSCSFDGAKMGSVEIDGADARLASFRDCDLSGATVVETDARGADFSNCIVAEAALDIVVDDLTRFDGMRGPLFAEFQLRNGDLTVTLDGHSLEEWLRARGGEVEILRPRRSR